MAEIVIGTSGYSYRDWVGPVYPPDTAPERFLELYAERFSFVELNFSYYRMPQSQLLRSMIERTPEGFRFAIKAHRSLTHGGGLPAAEALAEYRSAVAPLAEAARLSAVLLQFPFSFHYTVSNRRILAELCRGLGALPLFVEFRNAAWCRESVYAELRRRGIGWVVPDLPALPRLPRPDPVVTTNAAYLRLHGHNRDMWWDGDARSRYDYTYPDAELESLAPLARRLATEAGRLFVAFNNHADGQAAADAARFARVLAVGA